MTEPAGPSRHDPEALLADARSMIGAAADGGVPMRLLGGLAVYALAPSAREAPLARAYRDFDVAVPARQGHAASRLLEAAGHVPDRHFNALHGAKRLIFTAPRGYAVDVLVGSFEMAHRLQIADAFAEHPLTIAPAHLLLTKLQIVEIEAKDLTDAAALLLDVPVDAHRFVAPLADDWGFFHTVELNLPKLRAFGDAMLDPRRAATLAERVERLAAAMVAMPKSVRWKLRARVGERLTWFETPEEVD